MTIGLIIPAHNERKTLGKCLESALAAGFDRDDILVVDDGSVDCTWHVASLARVNCIVNDRNVGKARAIERAVGEFVSRGGYEWLGVLDADTELAPDYLERMRAAIAAEPDAAVICGSPRNRPYNWLTAYRAVEYAVSLGIYREAQHFAGAITVAPGCASVYRTAVMCELDFSPDTLTEDMDLTIQVQRRGHRVSYCPDAVVYTQDPRTLRDYAGQVLRWYTGTWQCIRKHRLGRGGQPVDAGIALACGEGLLFSLLLMIALPLGWLYAPLMLKVTLAADQALFAAMTALVARRERRWDVIRWYPVFSIPRLLNAALFLYAFIRTRRSRALGWFSVERY